MSKPLQTWQRSKDRTERELPALSREERHALHKLRMDAHKAGVKLASAGRGGLSPSLVLHVLRRDGFRCKLCGGDGGGVGISLHHLGGLENPTSKWLARKGKSNEPANVVAICTTCHDQVHDADRARGDQ
jgi:hypothetical protein